MKAELLNEFYLLQQSRSNETIMSKYSHTAMNIARDSFITNPHVASWVSRRGLMLMNLESIMNRQVRKFKKKYFRF
ncbi:hypothetical protein AAKU52_000366 [Pedobacter sp. CG_S7]|uniref:hypothetical protein n=1 Tax=Pedobacter sp. CG_S7 TaxID=3143930 RepID=UPI0033958335